VIDRGVAEVGERTHLNSGVCTAMYKESGCRIGPEFGDTCCDELRLVPRLLPISLAVTPNCKAPRRSDLNVESGADTSCLKMLVDDAGNGGVRRRNPLRSGGS